jgi:tetratricopeptide (TPR) repeat protein
MRGMWRSAQSDYQGSFADYSQLIVLNPKNVDAYLQRGKVRQALKDIEGAISDYKAALKIEPQNKMLKDALAYVEERQDPIAFRDRKIQDNPKDIAALQQRAHEAFGKNDYAQAIADYSSILKVDPKNKNALADRANSYFWSKQFDKAVSDYSALIQLDPQSPEYYSERADNYERMNEIGKQIADYQILSRLYRAQKNNDKATSVEERVEAIRHHLERIKDFTQRIQKDPQDPCLYRNRGMEDRYSKNAKGDLEKAKELFRRNGNLEQAHLCESIMKGIDCELKGVSC